MREIAGCISDTEAFPVAVNPIDEESLNYFWGSILGDFFLPTPAYLWP
jgi:hypothetical protein